MTFMSCFSSSERNGKPLCTSCASAPMHVINVATRNLLSFSFSFVTVSLASQTCFHFFQLSESLPFNSSRPIGGTFVVKVGKETCCVEPADGKETCYVKPVVESEAVKLSVISRFYRSLVKVSIRSPRATTT